jgi:G:T/U-mismatch repair DNA glycosylase
MSELKNYLVLAIRKLRPSAEFSFTDNDYSTIKWDVLEGKAPTQNEIDKAIEEIKKEELEAVAAKQAEKEAIAAKLGLTAEELVKLLG